MQNVNFKHADIGTMIYFYGVIIKIGSNEKLFLPKLDTGLKNGVEGCSDFVFQNVILI